MDQAFILHLPSDILYNIFVDIWREDVDNYFPELERLEPRFSITISHVCRKWRSFAIASPIFWSNIKFSHRMVKDRSIEQTEVWLERSQNIGLEIEMPYIGSNHYVAMVMKALLPHVDHWKPFKVPRGLKPTILRTIFDKLVYCSSSQLEVLECNTPGMRRWMFQPFSGGTPNLRRLAITSTRFKLDLPIFKGLTRLDIDSWNVENREGRFNVNDMFIPLSLAAATLEEFHFTAPTYVNLSLEDKPPFLPLNMPMLHTITTDCVGGHNPQPSSLPVIEHIYRGILAPVLRSQRLPFSSFQSLTQNYSYNFGNLEKICIMFCQETTATLQVLDTLPHLKSLELTHFRVFDHRVLENTCPKLCELVLRGSRFMYDFPRLNGISESIEARQRRALQLKGCKDLLSNLTLSLVSLDRKDSTWLESNIENYTFSNHYYFSGMTAAGTRRESVRRMRGQRPMIFRDDRERRDL